MRRPLYPRAVSIHWTPPPHKRKKEERRRLLSSEPTIEGGYLPARGRFPWFAFFIRSFLSLRRRVLAMLSPLPGSCPPCLCTVKRFGRPRRGGVTSKNGLPRAKKVASCPQPYTTTRNLSTARLARYPEAISLMVALALLVDERGRNMHCNTPAGRHAA
jgi:hypothetical protein